MKFSLWDFYKILFTFTRSDNNRFRVRFAKRTFYMKLASWLVYNSQKCPHYLVLRSWILDRLLTQIQDLFQPGFVCDFHTFYRADQGTKHCRIRIIRAYVKAPSDKWIGHDVWECLQDRSSVVSLAAICNTSVFTIQRCFLLLHKKLIQFQLTVLVGRTVGH